MKIICFSKNMSFYQGALYQQDVLDELSQQAEVFFYGPGFPSYDPKDGLSEVLSKASFTPDMFLVAHSWLNDTEGAPIAFHDFDFSGSSVPKIGILNKEYVNLKEKLHFFAKQKFDLLFSHHHNVEHYTNETKIKTIFWPFAVNDKVFNVQKDQERSIDIAFSGILQNQNKNAAQSDIRIQIMKKLFVSSFDFPLLKKRSYRKWNIFWNGLPRYRWSRKLASLFGQYKHLPLESYCDLQAKSKIYINALSPMDLVSTRFFENMASQCLIFAETSPLYEKIWGEGLVIPFQKDLSDFYEKINYFLENDEKRKEITTKAYKEVMTKHTWKYRVKDLLIRVQADGAHIYAK